MNIGHLMEAGFEIQYLLGSSVVMDWSQTIDIFVGLSKSYLVYIIPTMFSCFNMIVIRTYIAGLPDALVESARIDGAGDIRVFWQIIFPLCKPVLATVALFVAVGSWNSWFDTYLYNGGQKELHSLQYLLKMTGHHTGFRQCGENLRGGPPVHHPDHAGYHPLRDHGYLHGSHPGGISVPAEIFRDRHSAGQCKRLICCCSEPGANP